MEPAGLITRMIIQRIAMLPLICGSKKIIGDPFMK